MAVYFDHKLQDAPIGHHTIVEWHRSHLILALASDTQQAKGCLTFYKEDGERIADASIQRTYPLTAISWHPSKKVVAVGWENGLVSIYSLEEKPQIICENPPCHNGAINFIHWTSLGTKLLSGDSVGEICIWKTDSRGRLQHTPSKKQQLTESLCQCVLKPNINTDLNNDIAALARAAVSGDEKALDMFNWKTKGKNALKMSGASLSGNSESNNFFIGGDQGGIYYVTDDNEVVKKVTVDSGVRKLMFYENRNMLITITTNSMLSQHAVGADGDCQEIIKVKLSGKSDDPDYTWAGNGILATATGESVIRMWDMEKEENFVLTLDGNQAFEAGEKIFCVSYCETKQLLAAGTGSGHIALFKHKPPANQGERIEPETCWQLQSPCSLSGCITKISWGTNKMLLSANLFESVYIMKEQVLQAYYNQETTVVQRGPMKLTVEFFQSDTFKELNTDIQITGVCITNENLAIWNGKKVVIYETSSAIAVAGTFISDTSIARLFEQNVYTLEGSKVQIRNFQGTVKQLLNFTELEGDPISLEICKTFLVVASSLGTVKVYDLGRREAKQIICKNMAPSIENFGSIMTAKCNCTGSQISIIVNKSAAQPVTDSKLYIYDVEMDKITFFNFETGRCEGEELANEFEADDLADNELSAMERGRKEVSKDISGRSPISHYWDNNEPKLLVCDAKLNNWSEKLNSRPKNDYSVTSLSTKWSSSTQQLETVHEILIISLFVTQDNGILIQDSFPLPIDITTLLGVDVPYYYLVGKSVDNRPANRKVMRDFIGLENADKQAREAMMNFSYFSTLGNMDEAFKSIKLIKNSSVWENMAKMCVKTKRLDVAAVCLGNMGNARAARMLRKAIGNSSQSDLDSKVAMLANQLGLTDEAERLLKNSKNFNQLNQVYQAKNQWTKAIETASNFDRMHVRSTYYNYAKFLEANDNIPAAKNNYELSDTHRFQVPRMLFDDPRQLEDYIMKHKDKALRKWWAQYMESTGEMETALQFYQAAGDVLSLVRVYCYCGNLEKAAEICQETGDKAACFHLGRQYEMNESVKDAIHWFTRATAFGSAIRLCRDNGMDDQLLNLALLAKPHDQLEAARYYEQQPNGAEKAVMLYHKAGFVAKALDLAFNAKQFNALHMISEQLEGCNDPAVLERCADFFLDNGQFDRAVDLLATAKKYWPAIKLCAEQHVEVNEDLAERLTPPKPEDGQDETEYKRLLEAVGEICAQQRMYHVATKKFTQAGNRLKAMKCLLKSGDTEKITFFANVSKQKQIYVMAANYLQSLDWSRQPEIMKNIITFYTKGRALDSLSSFYDACSQVEMDEYQNYQKALGALTESYKCLAKANQRDDGGQEFFEERLADIKQRLTILKKFVDIQASYETDSEAAIKECQQLLLVERVDKALRIGSVFALMVQHFVKKEKWKAAYSCVEEFISRDKSAKLTFYIEPRYLESIYKAVDKPLPKQGSVVINGSNSQTDLEDDEIIEEDVPTF